MKKHLSTVLLFLVLIVGIGLLAYPTFADYWNSIHQMRVIAQYNDQVNQDATISQDYSDKWEQAERYNSTLTKRKHRFTTNLPPDHDEYMKMLDITGAGVMGMIEIPKINVLLPIYHGTEDVILQIAIGHVEGSSLPTGSVGTHVALSGHRGLPSSTLFTHLDKMELEDIFTIRVLDRVFTFEVDQIRIVLPNEIQDLEIDPEQTYCTLITCTPYGINTHRMLVRGHLIENPEAEIQIRIVADASQIEPLLVAPVVAAPILLLLLIIMMVTTNGGNKKRKER